MDFLAAFIRIITALKYGLSSKKLLTFEKNSFTVACDMNLISLSGLASGDSDVGDNVMLVFMMVTDSRCWWQNHDVGDFFRYVGDFFNVLNRSPTS